jgi:HSP20 family protein
VPAIDFCETETDLVVKAELPGAEKKDLTIEALPDALTIGAKTSHEKEEKGETFYRRECGWGEFQRVIPLPVEVKPEGVKATLKDGVLEVTLPKTETAKAKQPRKIEIG